MNEQLGKRSLLNDHVVKLMSARRWARVASVFGVLIASLVTTISDNSADSFGLSLERLRAFAAWSGAKLTAREEQVLADLLDGKTNPEIAVSLGVRTRTVAFHVSNLLYKFASASRLRLVAKWAGWSAGARR